MHYARFENRRIARRLHRRIWWETHVWFPIVGTLIMVAGFAFLTWMLCLALRMLNVAEGLPADYPAN